VTDIFDLSLSEMLDRLELVGDAVLSYVVTALIWELYPGLQVGPFTVVFFKIHTRPSS
jgi:dsRNA-specific ribonuclease